MTRPLSSARSTRPAATASLIWTSPVASPIGAADARQSLMPLYWAGLWLAVNIAAGASSRPEAKYTRSVDARPTSTTSAPASVAPSTKAALSGTDDGRMSWPTMTVDAAVNRAKALPIFFATDSSI